MTSSIGRLVFECPTTLYVIESGIITDRRTLAQIQHCKVRLTCNACGHRHEFEVAGGELSVFGQERPERRQLQATIVMTPKDKKACHRGQ
jgi:hypothetical protein